MQIYSGIQPNQVLAGIDKIRVAFPISTDLENVLSEMFGISLKAFTVSNKKNPRWFGKRYDCITKCKHTLIVIHTNHIGWLGGRKNLITVNGLALSKLAYNPFRHIPIQQVLRAIRDNGGTISSFDSYIDVTSNLVPFGQLMEQALPHNYRRYLRCRFIRDRGGVPQFPKIVGDSTIYYGKNSRNCCQISAYDKRLNPRQDIFTEDNALKWPYYRIELRFKGRTAHREALRLFRVVDSVPEGRAPLEKVVTDLFKQKWIPITPTRSRPSNCEPQQWYLDMLDQATSL